MSNTDINVIYHRHMSAMQLIAEKDSIHSSAIGLSLYLALGELADKLTASAQTDWYAHIRHLTDYLSAADRLVIPEYAVERAIELLQLYAAKALTANQLALWLERNEPALYHDPDASIADSILIVLDRRSKRLEKLLKELDAADRQRAELEAENERLGVAVASLQSTLITMRAASGTDDNPGCDANGNCG